jgi:hypothetical protein
MARHPVTAKTIVLIVLLAISSFFPEDAVAVGALYGAEDLSLWETVNASAIVEGQGLAIRGGSFAALSAPRGLGLPPDATIASIEAANRGSGACVMSLFAGGVHVKDATLRRGGRDAAFMVYDIYLRGPQRGLSGPVIAFQCADVDVMVRSVRFFRPPPFSMEMLGVLWGEFWGGDAITAFTINSVAGPEAGPFSFPAMIHALLAASAVVSYAIIRVFRGAAAREAASKAALAAFIVAGFAFAVRMDYGWLSVLRDETASLSGKETLDRVKAVNNGYLDRLLDFTEWVRRTVPPGAIVEPAALDGSSRFAALARYYLLPVRTSSGAGYLWVFGDEGVEFSPEDGSLMDGERVVASGVRPFATHGDGSALYERVR